MNIKKILKHLALPLAALYLLTRLINLLSLPIFNDEAIYIDWGSKELNSNGLLFYSLYDGKPPLLMWLFGIAHKIISDPLLAARLVSVTTGLLTLIGIYKLAEKVVNQKTAIFSSLFYIAIPLFTFFDRQALMESATSAIGVWSIYLFTAFLERPILKKALLLGAIWGVGLFIKQTALVFILAQIIIYFWVAIRRKTYTFNWNFLAALYISQIVLIPLYLQKNFWTSLAGNSRFTLGLGEVLSFPILAWLTNLQSIFLIPFWYLFPPLLVLVIIGLWKSRQGLQKITTSFFFVCLAIILVSFRTISPRYLVSFLPLSSIFAAYALTIYNPQIKIMKYILFIIAIIIPAMFTTLLITKPLNYFDSLNRFTNYSQKEDYVSGWTSGYGVREAINYIAALAQKTPLEVGVRVDAGNPESAVFAYFYKSKNVTPTYFDAKYIDPSILKYNCLKSASPFYFVARDGNLAGMAKFLTLDKVFKKPEGTNFVSVYTLKQDCKGGTLQL